MTDFENIKTDIAAMHALVMSHHMGLMELLNHVKHLRDQQQRFEKRLVLLEQNCEQTTIERIEHV